MDMEFQWDNRKAAGNLRKHGIKFDEASTAFYDADAMVIHDPDHSDEEERFILLGISSKQRSLIVCHCYRENDEVIRIISARKATRKEARQYKEKYAQ